MDFEDVAIPLCRDANTPDEENDKGYEVFKIIYNYFYVKYDHICHTYLIRIDLQGEVVTTRG